VPRPPEVVGQIAEVAELVGNVRQDGKRAERTAGHDHLIVGARPLGRADIFNLSRVPAGGNAAISPSIRGDAPAAPAASQRFLFQRAAKYLGPLPSHVPSHSRAMGGNEVTPSTPSRAPSRAIARLLRNRAERAPRTGECAHLRIIPYERNGADV